MHELTLAENVVRIVEKAVLKKGGVSKVTRVLLSIGKLSHVDSDTFLYCCGIISRGSLLENAVFDVERPPGKAKCNSCGHFFLLDNLLQECPGCASHDFSIENGDQLKVVEIGFI